MRRALVGPGRRSRSRYGIAGQARPGEVVSTPFTPPPLLVFASEGFIFPIFVTLNDDDVLFYKINFKLEKKNALG